MRKLLGPHLSGSWANNLETLRKWQPSLALVLSPDVDKVQQLRAACPGVRVIGRYYHDDSHYASNINARPEDFAHEIHNEIVNNPVTPLLDYVQSNNETNQDWEGIQKLNTYSQQWMNLADQSGKYKCAILAFSVGNPDMPYKPGDPAGFDGRMLYWQRVLPSLNYAQQMGHILLMHAYGYPNMFAPDADWYIYRYERQVQANLRTLGITSLRYAYGEIGIDRLIVGEKGGYKSVPTSDQDYTNQTLQWERDQQNQNLLMGGAIFCFGDSGGWGSYDITTTNAANMIATHYADHAADYAAPDAGSVVKPAEQRLALGNKAMVNIVVNVRKTPGYIGKPADDVVKTLVPGTIITLNSGPQYVDNIVWWGVDSEGGWVAESSAAGDMLLVPAPEEDGSTLFIPAVGTGGEPVSPTPLPDVIWDERLTERGVVLTPYVPKPNEGYWRITKGEYWEEKEHTFAVTLDANGNRQAGVTMRWWWADGKEDKDTELKPNDRWMVDFGMYAHGNSYGLKAIDGPSDSVFGMGLGSVEQPDWNIHVSYWFEFKWTIASAEPVVPSSVTTPSPTPRFKIGDMPYAGGYANVRRTPGYVSKADGDVIATLEPGTRMEIVQGPRIVDGLVWYGIAPRAGWVAESDPSGHVLLTQQSTVGTVDSIPPLAHPLFLGPWPITQIFGVNEANYKQFVYDGVPLMGHNGVDFGVPVGTHVQAVDGGSVIEIGDEGKKGFGKYIKLQHPWGESLYAHLSQIDVKKGDAVVSAQRIGLSGNTGNSTGPHLHFGMRKTGYKRGDGWGGYIDPLPYLQQGKSDIKSIVADAAKEFGVDEDILLNLVYAENKFSTDNKPSSAGAIGPAQIMPATWQEWAPRINAKNITSATDNIRVGAKYLSWLTERFKGDVKDALYAYNFGIGNMQKGVEPPLKTHIYVHSILHGAGFAKAVRRL